MLRILFILLRMKKKINTCAISTANTVGHEVWILSSDNGELVAAGAELPLSLITVVSLRISNIFISLPMLLYTMCSIPSLPLYLRLRMRPSISTNLPLLRYWLAITLNLSNSVMLCYSVRIWGFHYGSAFVLINSHKKIGYHMTFLRDHGLSE